MAGAKKVILMMNVSLLGYVARLHHNLSWLFGEPHYEAEEWTLQTLAATDTQPIGRVNFLERQLLSIRCPGSGLIEEYKLMADPIALGAGLPLFADEFNLKLVDSRPFPISIWLRQCETPLLRRARPAWATSSRRRASGTSVTANCSACRRSAPDGRRPVRPTIKLA